MALVTVWIEALMSLSVFVGGCFASVAVFRVIHK